MATRGGGRKRNHCEGQEKEASRKMSLLKKDIYVKRKEGILQKWGLRKEIDEKRKFVHERNRDERNSKDGRKEDYIVTSKK